MACRSESRALLVIVATALVSVHNAAMPVASAPTTARARARAEITEEIMREARRQLAEVGTDLSLRAVARALGMASSAVYRYFASRDELLTALIVETYDTVGEAAERAARGRGVHGRRAMDGARRRDPQLGLRPSPRLLTGVRQPRARLPSAAGHDRPGGAGQPGGAADHPRRRRVRGDRDGRRGADAERSPGRSHPDQRPRRDRPPAGRPRARG